MKNNQRIIGSGGAKDLIQASPPLLNTFIGMSVLILLYFVAYIIVQYVSRSTEVLFIAGKPLPYSAFASVFASLANICIIIIVVYYKKFGFLAALIMLAFQFPSIISRVFGSLNPSAIGGFFTNILTITAIIMIRINARKAERSSAIIREQAILDRLTKLPNRYAYSEALDTLIKHGRKFVIVSIDINTFKGINETMGYDMGNKVLIEIAARWKNIADSRSSSKRDMIARVSGDEFVLIIRDYHTEKDLLETIVLYEKALHDLTIDDCDLYISASFGYAEFPIDANNSDSLASCADAAMHEVKRLNSGDHILRYTPELLKTERIVEIEHDIRAALDKDQFYINLQPQFDMNHKLRGFEALARMKDPDGNIVSPSEFIPVAEKVGLIDKIDYRVFSKAARFFGDIIKETGTDIIFSINVSVRHLMKNNFLEEVKKGIEIYGIPANQLEVEITESIMIDSVEKALQCVNELKKMGVTIAIDDFGTGYSSLSYLSKFPADYLKIDKEFIDQMDSSESSKQYVASIISIGHVMNFDVIAEGVEKPEQIDTLKEIGCDYIQGYVWGRPMNEEEASKLIRDKS